MGSLSIALSGMQAAQVRLAGSAHNVANWLTEEPRSVRVDSVARAGGGVEAVARPNPPTQPVRLERELVDQLRARTQFLGSARVFEASSEMQGLLVDLFA